MALQQQKFPAPDKFPCRLSNKHPHMTLDHSCRYSQHYSMWMQVGGTLLPSQMQTSHRHRNTCLPLWMTYMTMNHSLFGEVWRSPWFPGFDSFSSRSSSFICLVLFCTSKSSVPPSLWSSLWRRIIQHTADWWPSLHTCHLPTWKHSRLAAIAAGSKNKH